MSPRSFLAFLAVSGATPVCSAQINSFEITSPLQINPGEPITISASYAPGTTAFVTTPYAIEEIGEALPGFTYDSTTQKGKLTPADATSITISTAGWKPGVHHFTLQASNGAYRDFAVKVGMPHSQYRIVEEYDGPIAGGGEGILQNLLVIPGQRDPANPTSPYGIGGVVTAGIYSTPLGPNAGETWSTRTTTPVIYGERYYRQGYGPRISGFKNALPITTVSPGVWEYQARESDFEGTIGNNFTAKVTVPLARAGFAHDEYIGPLLHRSVVHIPDGTLEGTLLATAYVNFEGDDELWRWTGPNPNSTTQNPNSKRLRAIAIKSTDGGRRWNYLSTIASDDVTGMEGYSETSMKRLPNGDLLALMRTGDEAWAGYGQGTGQLGDGWKDNPMMVARSTDNGKTWSAPWRSGVESVSPDLNVLSDGSMVASYGRPGHSIMFSVNGGNSFVDHYSIQPDHYSGYMAVAEPVPGMLLVGYKTDDYLDPVSGTRSDVNRIKRLRVSRWGEGILAHDSFDYATAGNLANANGGGGGRVTDTGFDGPWKADAALTQTVDIDVASASLTAPSGYGLPPEGGRLVGDSSSSRAAYRALKDASKIDLSVDQDYFVSMLVKRQNSGAGSESFSFKLLADTTTEAEFAISSSGVPTITTLGNATTGTGTMGFDQTYLLALKIDANASTTADRAYMKLYAPGDIVNLTEPSSWNVVGTSEVNNAILNRLGFLWGNESTLIYQIDELRVAKTWEESVILGGRRVRLKAYEPFNYANTGTLGAGGIGFSGGWFSDPNLTTPVDVGLAKGSLTPPRGYTAATEGNRMHGVSTDAPHSAYRALSAEGQIDMGVDQTYFVGLLAKRTDEGNAGTKGFTVSLLEGNDAEVQFGASTSGSLSISGLGSAASTAGAPFGFDETFFVVLQIIASETGEDRAYLKLYGEGDVIDTSLPGLTEWDLAGNGELNDSLLDRIGISWGNAEGLVFEMDELRIATKWDDLAVLNWMVGSTSNPEPGAAGLVMMVGGTMLMRRRRRHTR